MLHLQMQCSTDVDMGQWQALHVTTTSNSSFNLNCTALSCLEPTVPNTDTSKEGLFFLYIFVVRKIELSGAAILHVITIV